MHSSVHQYDVSLTLESPLIAIRAVVEMADAPDFDRKMLLLATKLAHEHKMRSLLLSILEKLLSTLQSNAALETEVEAMILIRFVLNGKLGQIRVFAHHCSLPAGVWSE